MGWGQKEGAQAQKVTIKIADNLPDRTNGMGLVTQTVLDDFAKSHPNVAFEVESYPDQPYRQKMKLYATAGQLPELLEEIEGNVRHCLDATLHARGGRLARGVDGLAAEYRRLSSYRGCASRMVIRARKQVCRAFHRTTGRPPLAFSREISLPRSS